MGRSEGWGGVRGGEGVGRSEGKKGDQVMETGRKRRIEVVGE